MRIDYNCVRDMMLYIEENTPTFNSSLTLNDIKSELCKLYDVATIDNSMDYIEQCGFVNTMVFMNSNRLITQLTPLGHRYIDRL